MALMSGIAIIKAAIDSDGSFEGFEAHLRHYTDQLETSPDGGFLLVEYPHPILLTVLICMGSAALAAVSLRLTLRLNQRNGITGRST